MHSDPLISEPAHQILVASQTAPGHRVLISEAAPTTNVMFDQLEYLVGPRKPRVSGRCQDCIRLREIEGWLLQPFRTTEIRKLRTSPTRSSHYIRAERLSILLQNDAIEKCRAVPLAVPVLGGRRPLRALW